MEWLGKQCGFGVMRPEEMNHLDVRSTIYRFFELFDLGKVPNGWEMLAGNMTPPPKPQLEEKALFALLWMEQLRPFWREMLGEGTLQALQEHMPQTWIV